MNIETNQNIFGIDVSAYQGDIDWSKVSKAGVKFAYIKATEGATFVDKNYAHNIAAARTAKIPCGAYHFFHPKISVQAQIQNFVRTIGHLEIGDLPPVLDLESASEWSGISVPNRITLVLEWLTAIEVQLQCYPLIYLSSSFAGDVLGHAKQLSNYDLWVAHYTKLPKPTVPAPWNNYTFWQYTNQGAIDGIDGLVDLDWFNGTAAQLSNLIQK